MNLRDWFHRKRKDRDLREELDFHLQSEAEERIADGLSERDARFAARRDLGNAALVHEEARSVWTWTTVEQLGQDLRYALRSMAANRVFTALAVLSLALGIGANTAIYSFVESILLRSLPVADPHSLVLLKWRARGFPSVARSFTIMTGGTHREDGGSTLGTEFPYPALDLFRENRAVFANVFAYYAAGDLNVSAGNVAEAVSTQYVSGDYFRGMGVPTAAGRFIADSDDQSGAARVAVVSYRYAVQHFGDVAEAPGRTIRVDTTIFQIAGVAPPDFFGAEPAAAPDVFLPIHTLTRNFADRHYYWVQIMARLKPGVGVAQAASVLRPQFHEFAVASMTSEKDRSNLPVLQIAAGAGGLESLRFRYAKPLYVLMALAGSILLIACANVANLLLARATARRREIAVRLGLGAGRLRIIRQLLTESVLLAALSGAAAILFALWGIRLITLLLAIGRNDFTLRAEINWPVLGVTLGMSLLTGLLFGLAPALQSTRGDVLSALKNARAAVLMPRISPSHLLIGAQIAFSLLLLVAAGLFGRTLTNLHSIHLGFNRENVLLFTIKPRAAGYDASAVKPLYLGLQERLSRIPGVRAASYSSRPLPAGSGTKARITVLGSTVDSPVITSLFYTGPGFLSTMQIPLLAGRDLDPRDSQAVVVNQSFASAFHLTNPIGRTIVLSNARHEIVGVAGDALFLNLKDKLEPGIYFPAEDSYQVSFEVRSAGNPIALASAVREAVRQTDPRLAVSDLKTQAAHIDQAINQEIALARLCTVFAALALLIACVGLYGTVAYNVERRTPEIGIRMALGAPRLAVVRLVLSEVFAISLVGVAIGFPVALAGSRYTQSMLYGVEPHDPASLASAVAILVVAALAAALAPARRASRIEPTVALRHE